MADGEGDFFDDGFAGTPAGVEAKGRHAGFLVGPLFRGIGQLEAADDGAGSLCGLQNGMVGKLLCWFALNALTNMGEV